MKKKNRIGHYYPRIFWSVVLFDMALRIGNFAMPMRCVFFVKRVVFSRFVLRLHYNLQCWLIRTNVGYFLVRIKKKKKM